jgi:hypothetical protein
MLLLCSKQVQTETHEILCYKNDIARCLGTVQPNVVPGNVLLENDTEKRKHVTPALALYLEMSRFETEAAKINIQKHAKTISQNDTVE